MTSHSIGSTTLYHRFSDEQNGVNSLPKDGRYDSINYYFRAVSCDPRCQDGIYYYPSTQTYEREQWVYSTPPGWIPDLEESSYLLAKNIVKMHNAFDSVQLAKDMAEACGATARFFKSVPQSIRYLRKGQFAKAYKALAGSQTVRQSIPATYLQYQWAVKPLISELEELWEKLNPPEKPVFKLSAATGCSDETILTDQVIEFGQALNVDWKRSANRSVKSVRYFRHDVLDTQGFHFNPLGAVWDGIPWSFLVDWFIPVSDVLKGMSYSIPGCIAGFDNFRDELVDTIDGPVYPYEVWNDDHSCSFRVEPIETKFRTFIFERRPNTSTSLSATQVSDLLWSSPAGLTLKRVLNLFNVAWVFASRK
jgi:hypothetical protein